MKGQGMPRYVEGKGYFNFCHGAHNLKIFIYLAVGAVLYLAIFEIICRVFFDVREYKWFARVLVEDLLQFGADEDTNIFLSLICFKKYPAIPDIDTFQEYTVFEPGALSVIGK